MIGFIVARHSFLWIRTKAISFSRFVNCCRGRRSHSYSEDVIFTHVVEEVDGQLGFEGELPTPKSLGERSIRVRVRDGAPKFVVPTITVGIHIVIHTTREIRIWT